MSPPPATAAATSPSPAAPVSTSLVVGAKLHGFTVERVTPVEGLRATAYQLTHDKTGARLLHLHNTDSENLFSITFRTPVRDSTGVPHILEHSVLAGSEKYPVKEPFFEMVKSSMATFINAMTGLDHTMYPVSSTVKRDFYNLADVYCDAVFHPLLTEPTFRREGHHLEFEKRGDADSALTIKGIVYNEMKGYYSRADGLAGGKAFQWLFPDTQYGHDSGGDPDAIPDLSYHAFKQFHANLYHPSNAYIFLCGDIPTEEHLAFLNPRLGAFDHRQADTHMHRQPQWKQPLVREATYPVGPGEDTARKTYFVLGWIVGDAKDGPDVIAWNVLDRVLLGNQGAPLRKAIVDSKLGQDVFSSGFSAYVEQTVYEVGIKGSEPERKNNFQELILNTLENIAATGITRQRVEAAFQQTAYAFLEISTGYGLGLMQRANLTWIYGADPLIYLKAGELLEDLKQRYARDPELFSRMIRERLLKNPHRLLTAFTPDPAKAAADEAAFKEKMRQIKAHMSPEQLRQVADGVEELDRLQNTPTPPEALAALPRLNVSDLPKKPRHIPTTIEKIAGGIDLLRNDVFANGVNYLQLDIDLAGLDPDLFPYLPLYADCVRKMGAGDLDYAAMAQRAASHTGGVGFWAIIIPHAQDPDRLMRRGRFSTKFLDAKANDAMAVLNDYLFEMNPRDRPRLRDMVNQTRAAQRNNILSNGLGVAGHQASRGLSPEGALGHRMYGLPQMRMYESLFDNFTRDSEIVIENLERIRAFMLNRNRLTASFTGSGTAYETVRGALEEWASEMRADPVTDLPIPFEKRPPAREGLAAPLQVSYCTKVCPAPHQSDPAAPLLTIGGGFLGRGYLLEEIRFKGTAYGGGGSYNGANRTFNFFSYMDPNLSRTLKTFDASLDFVRSGEWAKPAVDNAIIYQTKEGERPIRPADATDTALSRHVLGITRELREQMFTGMLAATPQAVRQAVGDVLEKALPAGGVAVVSSREKLEAANTEGAALAIEDVIK